MDDAVHTQNKLEKDNFAEALYPAAAAAASSENECV